MIAARARAEPESIASRRGPSRTGTGWPAPGSIAIAIAVTAIAGCARLDPYAFDRDGAGSDDRRGPTQPKPGTSAPGQAPGSTAGPGGAGGQGPRTGPGTGPSTGSGGPGASKAGPSAADPDAIPASVRPPISVPERFRALAIGDITYECRRHLVEPTRFVWSFVVPAATLYDANRKPIGRYYAGPTWEGQDRSKVTGRQVAVARVSGSDLPLQLVEADVSTGTGIMKGVRYIQRLASTGGAPSGPCDETQAGRRQQVGFEAAYVFY